MYFYKLEGKTLFVSFLFSGASYRVYLIELSWELGRAWIGDRILGVGILAEPFFSFVALALNPSGP